MRSERGQAAPLLAVTILVVGLVTVALVDLASELAGRGRAQAVADLTALAGTAGRAPADLVAARNGAAVVRWSEGPDSTVTVVVELDGRRAVAAATTVVRAAVAGSADGG